MNKTKEIINDSARRMESLNKEHIKRKRRNQLKSHSIRSSIESKSDLMKKNRESRSKHFDFIHNK